LRWNNIKLSIKRNFIGMQKKWFWAFIRTQSLILSIQNHCLLKLTKLFQAIFTAKKKAIFVHLCLFLCGTIAQDKPLRQSKSGEIAHNRTTLAHELAFLRTVFNLKFFKIFLRILGKSKNDLKEEKVKR